MALQSYLRLLLAKPRLLAFGFLMTFASSAGQTFFIGTFGPAVRDEFSLSHGEWGGIYMAGTLLSALVLPWTGQQIDRLPLIRYATLVCLALIVASAFIGLVPSAAFLILAIFLLRQSGQGLASHTGTTAMARFFGKDRGKAIAVASMGYAAGETLLPFLAVLGIATLGWRQTYGVTTLLLVLFLLPSVWWLLRGENAQPADATGQAANPATSDWSRAQVLRDGRFYLLLPAVLAPSFIGTALFFHHLPLAAAKGWSATWITGSYWIYAVAAVLASIVAGPLIDRFTALRVLPGFLLPMATGLLMLWAFDAALWAWPYLFLLGLSSGITYIAVTALWAEVYGTRHIGAIRSMAVAFSVFASALGPVVMGAMMDKNLTIETISALFALYCLIATALLWLALGRFNRSKQTVRLSS